MPVLAPLLALLASAPALELVPAVARPGDAVLLRVGAAGEPQGILAGQPLHFWRAGEEWWALAALPVELTPGPLPVRVEAGGAPLTAELTVVEPGFTRHALTLDRKYVEPPASVQKQIARDRKAFARAFAQPFGPPFFQGDFAWPRHAETSGRFGDQRVLNGKVKSVHYGLDIVGPRGAPVAAANDGLVVIARKAYFSGNTVVVYHGAGLYTAYFHLDRMAVAAGRRVSKGDLLGQLGATGRATGPHLHWGVKVAGLYVDPESLLAIDFAHGTAPDRRTGAPPSPDQPSNPSTEEPPQQAEP
ncbi:MAG TPA: M23 family metallopeptidase [Anaeromyxobacter sp.]|nr:M23 family metallopeptidase [Anaeromyxobacter sp.]